ncbi:MAG: hypothetical protein ACLPIG_19130, partial [Methylocella sp.]
MSVYDECLMSRQKIHDTRLTHSGYLGNASSIRVYLRTSIEGVLLMLRKLSLIAAMAAALAFPSAA